MIHIYEVMIENFSQLDTICLPSGVHSDQLVLSDDMRRVTRFLSSMSTEATRDERVKYEKLIKREQESVGLSLRPLWMAFPTVERSGGAEIFASVPPL